MKLFKTGAQEEPAGAALTCTAQTAPKLCEVGAQAMLQLLPIWAMNRG